MQSRPNDNCIISAVRWVPRGCFSLKPMKADLYTTPEEIEKYKLETEEQQTLDNRMSHSVEEMDEDGDSIDNDEELKEYNMADYDKENEIDIQQELFKSLGVSHIAPEQDPYLNRDRKYNEQDEMESDEDEEDELLPSDYQLVSCYNEDEGVSTLQVHIYEPNEQNLFLHHDMMLTSFALCVEWLSYLPGSNTNEKKNLAAVGTFDPEIEIWDLDVVDSVKPVAKLGSLSEVASKKKKNKSVNNDKTHTAPVLNLAWHPLHFNILASASEDRTVKIWDLQSLEPKFSLNTLHTTPVSAIAWHSREANILLTGGFDKKCLVIDSMSKSKMEFVVPHDVESISWNPHYPNAFSASLSSGLMITYDIRNQKQPLHKWQAHDKKMAASDFSYSAIVKDLLVTCSHDGSIKFWCQNCSESGQTVQEIESAELGFGQCYTVSFYENLLAVGGQKGKLQVLNCLNNQKLKSLFTNKI
jgi:periodic tryptophan protein 1